MAEAEQKPLSLAEQWSLQDGGKQSDQSEIPVKEMTENEKPAGATSEEVVPENANEIPVADDSIPSAEENNEVDGVISVKETTENGMSSDTTSKEAVEIPVADDGTPVTEENNEAPEEEETAVQEDAEEKPEIKLETAPADFRFPTTNQTRHCFTRYIEYHRCIAAKGEGASECDKFAKYYRSLCPSEWVERWNEQRENGTFPGPL